MSFWHQLKRSALYACFLAILGASYAAGAMTCGGAACVDEPHDAGDLLRYADDIRALEGDSLENEYLQVEESFLEQETVINRFALALLLSMPEAPFRNDTRARALLRDYLKKNRGDDGYRYFADFLLNALNERRAMEQTLEAERKQHLLLRKQVEELKAIERRINRRDQSAEQEVKP